MKEFEYKGYSLREAVDGLMAYDFGATDSGIKDEKMKCAVVDYLNGLEEKEADFVLSLIAQEWLKKGFFEVVDLVNWLKEIGVL